MLKVFYKSILISMLSGTLLMSQMTVYAQTGTAAASHRTQVDGVSGDSMLSSITMLAIGFLATRLYKYPMTTDIGLAAAGGGIFVYGEISSNDKFKDLKDDLQLEIAQNSAAEPDAAQVEHIKGLKKSYVDANEILKTKKKIQIAASVAFAAAAVVALNMETVDDGLYNKCLGSVKASAGKCTDDTGYGLAGGEATSAAGLKLDADVNNMYQKIIRLSGTAVTPLSSTTTSQRVEVAQRKLSVATTKYVATLNRRAAQAKAEAASSQNPQAAVKATACTSAASAVSVGCRDLGQSLKPRQAHASDAFSNPFVQHENLQKNPNYFVRLLNFVISPAEAISKGLMFGLTGVAAGFFMKLAPELGDYTDRFLFSPKNRTLVWGILGGLSLFASMATQKEIDKIEGNIQKIDGILNAVKVVKNEKTNFFQNIFNMIFPKANAEASKVAAAPLVASKTLTSRVKMPCLAGPGDSNCPSLAAQLSNSGEDLNNLPPSFQTTVGRIVRLADDMNGTNSISAKTMADISNVGDQQMAVAALLTKMQDEANNKNIEMGIEKTDYAKEQAYMLAHLNSITAGVLEANKMTPATLLASYGGLAMPATDASSNSAAAAVKKTGPIGTTSVVAAVTAQNASTSGSLAANAPLEATDKVSGKVYKVNDISTNKDESIWTVISNRYLKSAFSKLID